MSHSEAEAAEFLNYGCFQRLGFSKTAATARVPASYPRLQARPLKWNQWRRRPIFLSTRHALLKRFSPSECHPYPPSPSPGSLCLSVSRVIEKSTERLLWSIRFTIDPPNEVGTSRRPVKNCQARGLYDASGIQFPRGSEK